LSSDVFLALAHAFVCLPVQKEKVMAAFSVQSSKQNLNKGYGGGSGQKKMMAAKGGRGRGRGRGKK
jgi:hypothetical protein